MTITIRDRARLSAAVRPALSSLVALVLVAPGLARAQEAPARRGPSQVEGRNAFLERALQAVGQRAARHVVEVRSRGGSLIGYGVVIEDGRVLTCASILPEAGAVTVQLAGGAPLAAGVAGRNLANDIAVLAVEWGGAAPEPIPQASTEELRIGQFVAVAGSEGILAAGVVSAKNRAVEASERGQQNILMGLFSDGNEGHKRAYPRVIHHDAPLQPEEFGAPLVDRQGRLLGINVANPYRGSSHAVGTDQLRLALAELSNDAQRAPHGARGATRPAPAPARGGVYLGVSVAPAERALLGLDYRFGLEVREVQGPAEAAGVQAGDVIVALDGAKLSDMQAFAKQITSHEPGDKVRLTVLRGKAGLVKDVEVTLGKR